MRKFSLVMLVLLAGCSDQLGGVTAPTTADVSAYATQSDQVSVSDRQMYSSEYLIASIYYSNQKCDEFFDALARFQQDSGFIDKVLTSAVAAGTPLMAAYKASSEATALFAASVSTASNVNKYRADIYAFAPYATSLRRHVKDQMVVYAANLKNDWDNGYLKPSSCIGNCSSELEKKIQVRGQAQGYANICSIANIRTIIDSSLANTVSKCTTTTNVSVADVSQSCEAVGRPSGANTRLEGAASLADPYVQNALTKAGKSK